MHKCNITSNDLVSDKEEDYMKQYNETVQKMINFDDVAKENIKKNTIKIGHKFLIIHTEY